MVAIGAVASVQASSQPIDLENPQTNRVTEATKGIFQQLKELIARAWRATVTGITTSINSISFVFFRVLEWVHPSLGPRVEVAFLRVSQVWQNIQAAWRAEEIRNQMNFLTSENQRLQTRVTELTGVSNENEHLRLDIARLTPFEQLAQTHAQRVEALVQQQTNITDRERAVVGQRDIYLAENNALKTENVQLVNQRNTTVALVSVSLARQKELEALLQSAQHEAIDLRSQIENNRGLHENLANIANACARLSPRSDQQKTEIDDGLEQLLPQLRGQMDRARQKLATAKQTLTLDHSAQIPLESLERTLNEITKYLDEVPKALQLHKSWQQPVYQIVHNNLVEV